MTSSSTTDCDPWEMIVTVHNRFRYFEDHGEGALAYHWKGKVYKCLGVTVLNSGHWTNLIKGVGDKELEVLQLNGLGRFLAPWKRHWIFSPKYGLLTGTKSHVLCTYNGYYRQR